MLLVVFDFQGMTSYWRPVVTFVFWIEQLLSNKPLTSVDV